MRPRLIVRSVKEYEFTPPQPNLRRNPVDTLTKVSEKTFKDEFSSDRMVTLFPNVLSSLVP